jgi:hypothetical protein
MDKILQVIDEAIASKSPTEARLLLEQLAVEVDALLDGIKPVVHNLSAQDITVAVPSLDTNQPT